MKHFDFTVLYDGHGTLCPTLPSGLCSLRALLLIALNKSIKSNQTLKNRISKYNSAFVGPIPVPDAPLPTPSEAPASGPKTNHFRIYLSFTLHTVVRRWRRRGRLQSRADLRHVKAGEAGDQTADLVTNGQAAPPPEETASAQGTHLAGQMPRVPDASSEGVNKHR